MNFLLLQTGSQSWITQEEQEEEEKIWSWSEWGREGDKFVKADRNSSAEFLPCTHMRNLTTLWIWFCRSFLWCKVLARGNLQEYWCVFSLRALESIATWMQISLLRDPSCSWQCASSSYLHHESASVFVRVSPGLNLFYTSTAPCKILLLSSFVPWSSGL